MLNKVPVHQDTVFIRAELYPIRLYMLYSSCPPEMRDTLLHHTQETVKELTELSEKFETN